MGDMKTPPEFAAAAERILSTTHLSVAALIDDLWQAAARTRDVHDVEADTMNNVVLLVSALAAHQGGEIRLPMSALTTTPGGLERHDDYRTNEIVFRAVAP